MILQELHVHIRVLRSVEVVAHWRSYGLSSVDVVACSTVVSSSSIVCIQGLRPANVASTRRQARKTRVHAALEMIDDTTVHRGRICASSRNLHCLILVRKVRILIHEGVVFPWLGVSQLSIAHLIGVLAVVAELVQLVRVCTRVAQPVCGRLPAVLRSADLVPSLAMRILLLTYQTDHGPLSHWSLTSGYARANGLVEIHNTSGALQRVTPETIGLVATLVEWPSDERPFAKIRVLGIDEFVATSVDRGESLRRHKRSSALIVANA